MSSHHSRQASVAAVGIFSCFCVYRLSTVVFTTCTISLCVCVCVCVCVVVVFVVVVEETFYSKDLYFHYIILSLFTSEERTVRILDSTLIL